MIIASICFLIGGIVFFLIDTIFEVKIWNYYPAFCSFLIILYQILLENQFNQIMRGVIKKYNNSIDDEIKTFLRINATTIVPIYKFKSNFAAKTVTSSLKYFYLGLFISISLLIKSHNFVIAVLFIIIFISIFFSDWKLRFYKGNEFDKIVATKRYIKKIGKNINEMTNSEIENESIKWDKSIQQLNKLLK